MNINSYLDSIEAAGDARDAFAHRFGWLPADWFEAENYGTRFIGTLDMPVGEDPEDDLARAWDAHLAESWVDPAERAG